MVFLDTNVFLYAVGREHPLRAPARAVLARLGRGELEATTSAEVVQEVLHVQWRRGKLSEGLRLARALLRLFPDLLPVGAGEIDEACRLLEQHPELPVRDALHAATLTRRGIEEIISADRHFDALPAVRRIDLASL